MLMQNRLALLNVDLYNSYLEPSDVIQGTPEDVAEVDDILVETTVVIPVKDDIRIFSCVHSVDEGAVEVIVVSNGSTREFRRMLETFLAPRAKLVMVDEPGIGRAYNHGIAAAGGRFILFMDSDCTFEPGTIRQLAFGARSAPLVKGRIDFDTAGPTTRFAAGIRAATEDAQRSGKITAYSPPLLYDREIVSELDGYHFADRLAWREDRDFELRRRRAQVPVVFAPAAVIRHAPLSVASDLRSVFNYGRGELVGRQLGYFPHEPRRRRLAKTVRTARRIAWRDRQPWIALYFLFRRLVFQFGVRTGPHPRLSRSDCGTKETV
jgi:glycosyltransferase involved in cell wall biosynthesis